MEACLDPENHQIAVMTEKSSDLSRVVIVVNGESLDSSVLGELGLRVLADRTDVSLLAAFRIPLLGGHVEVLQQVGFPRSINDLLTYAAAVATVVVLGMTLTTPS